ncbi:MAG: hypothetical protein QXP58_06740 [Thermoprotei archaeon]
MSEGDDFSGTSYQILGVSLTLSSSTLSETVTKDFGGITGSPATAEVYEYGQLALANYSVMWVGGGYPEFMGYAVQTFTMGLEIGKSGGSLLPVVRCYSILTAPFSANQAQYLGSVVAGNSLTEVSYGVVGNELPMLTVFIPISAIVLGLLSGGEAAALASILPNLDLVYQSSSTTVEFTQFQVVNSVRSPANLSVYVDVSAVDYYNGNSYTVALTLF